jgi:hypothetical protein
VGAADVLDALRGAGLELVVVDGYLRVHPSPPEWARVAIAEHRDALVAMLSGRRWFYAVEWYGSRRCTFATLGAARGFALALEAERGEEGARVVRHLPGQPLSPPPTRAGGPTPFDVGELLERAEWVPARLGRDCGGDDESQFT